MSLLKNVIITAIAIVAFTIIYFSLNSKENYNQQAQIIRLYYPIGIILGIITIVLLNSYFIKSGKSYIIISTIVMILFLFAFTFMLDVLYRPILSNYYKHDHSTLIGIVKYEGQKGNYIKIYKKMLKEGIYANSMAEGYSNQEGKLSETYTEQITYHINNVFIIFDWDKENVIKKEREEDILKGAYGYLMKNKNVTREQLDNYSINGCHIGVGSGKEYYNIIVYARDGEFAYSLQK